MKKTHLKYFSIVLAILLTVSVIFGALTVSGEQATYEASYVNKLESIVPVDLQEYLDNSVMFELPDSVKDDQDISVIITVNVEALMDAYEATDKKVSFTEFASDEENVAKVRKQIFEEQGKILAVLDDAGVTYTVGSTYDTILSGFELVICAKDFDITCKSLGDGEGIIVSEVYNVAETQLVENDVNVYETGIFKSEGSGYDGSGMVVAVLDTGLDSNHSAFSVDNFTSEKLGLTYNDVAAVINQTTASNMYEGLTADDVYINEKVPYGYDYADNDPDVYSTHNNHGTHVSGVIVGNDDTIIGVAPNAQLVSMKVFSDIMDTARSTWILSALEDCVVLGVDVINMSLGTACGFSRESDEEILNGVYDKIRAAGISMVVAASNSYSSAYGSESNGNLGLTSNPDTGTVGSPGTYKGVISVASINGVETPYILYDNIIIYFDESNTGAGEENDFCATLLGDEEKISIEYVVIPGVGRTADYTGLDVTGKVALVRRGDNTFEEKAMIAEAKGAAGIIIYNNVSGEVKMNVGDAKLAVCSISQDDGEMLAAKGGGTLKISKKQTSGPFMSDFSSWGPTPSLEIKPEITAHGGNILSSVTGGGYDRLSGTSMACPNMAGVVVLMRQYVVENFPEIANDNVKVGAMVNQLMMSTADIIINTNGLPYAVRKQGAGLANLLNAINTEAYVTTYDKDGNEMDKTKLELGDDPEKAGVYEMHFTVTNFGDSALTYDLGGYVLTEGVSDTKTNAGETTVTEEAVLLEGAKIEFSSDDDEGGTLKGTKLKVSAGESIDVTATITLTDENKKYLDKSFENGMYVEGFITLSAARGTKIDLSVPYLAYYGDWNVAPMFDLDYYETNADELDDSIAIEDKVMADAYATRPIGGISEDYVSYLGSYYFLQDPDDMIISASRDYIALSNQEGTIHTLRFVWAGMLRAAQRIEITITDDTTGEVVFETVDTDVRKSYGDGGSIYPANVEIEFDTMDYNLANNTEYTVTLVGYLDYGDGGLDTNEKNVFTFPLVVDFEAPTVTDVEFYYEYDKTLKKNRLYAKVGIYDNHYTMSSQLGYVTLDTVDDVESPAMKAFEQYMTPVYSQCDSTTYVTFELTDYIYEIKENSINKNSFVISCYDYALNYATYEIGLPDAYTDFYLESMEDEVLTLSPNEVYTLEPKVYPDTEWAELLEYASSRPSVVRVVNNKLVAVNSGSAIIRVRDSATNESVTFRVNVLKEGDAGYMRYDKPVADSFRLTGYDTIKAYYILDNEEKKLGDTGDTRFFEGNYNLTMYPSESVTLNYDLDAYFPNDTTVTFETSNDEIVKVDSSGTVTASGEGFAFVTVKVMMDGKSTYYSESVSVEVKDPYITSAASLTHYYGNGGLVDIPADLSLREIGNFAFSNFEYIAKTEEELAFDDAESTKQWFIGDNTITKVIIPEGVEKINAYAFANLTALEEVVLPSTLQSIEYGAFYNCTSLQKVTFSSENNLQIINQHAFENCDLQDTLDLSSACVISDYAFAGNQNLEKVVTTDALLSIGEYAFAGCKDMTEMVIEAAKVKYGPYAFTGCESLTSFYVNASVLPEGMFYECEAMESIVIGPDVNDIGEFAFRDTVVSSFEVQSGNKTYLAQKGSVILSTDKKTLVAVAPTESGTFDKTKVAASQITEIAAGAFSHNTKIATINLPEVTVIGDYGLASNKNLSSVSFGVLTNIGEYAFFETGITKLPAFSTDAQVGNYAFSYTKLTSVTIPDNTVIAEGVFSECLDLEKIIIGNNVTIGDYAFTLNKDLAFKVNNYSEKGEKYFYYSFYSSLSELTIGDNAVIGKNAFSNAASIKKVTLGENAQIGEMAFYNACSLKDIDLSKAKSIGNYAFSGDVYYVCLDDSMTVAAVSKDGHYIYTHHAPQLESVKLDAAESIGEYAFAYCRELENVTLNANVTDIPQYAFAGCIALKNIDLSKVTTIGDYAFMESEVLAKVDLSSAETVGEYAFVYGKALADVVLNPEGTDLGEAAFAYCDKLSTVKNMGASENIGDYAYAYTALTKADLSGAVSVGTQAFLKEKMTPFTITLGDKLEKLGDNPFAMCQLKPFALTETVDFNGKNYKNQVYTYDVSDKVSVIDGSLYCKIDTGLELITYVGTDPLDVKIVDDTVRITSMAFAGSDVKMVTLPYTVKSIGHKAFYDCDALETVVFNSYYAPILEEEFDPTYYESFEHIPGLGDFGTYTDYDGTEVQINGMGLIPYFMWNATDGMYSNIFYGANFIDYVGFVTDKITIVRPSNGQNYDSFIYAQYFDRIIDGSLAADDVTLAAIAAIKAIPEKVAYEDRDLVEAARAAYGKIATTEKQGLVYNYADLISAEQRIIALTPSDEPVDVAPEEESDNTGWIKWLIAGIVLLALAGAVVFVVIKPSRRQWVKNFASKVWNFLKPAAAWIKKIAKKVWNFLKPAVNWLKNILGIVWNFLKPAVLWVKKIALIVWKFIKPAFMWVKKIALIVWNFLKPAFKWVKKIAVIIWKYLWIAMKWVALLAKKVWKYICIAAIWVGKTACKLWASLKKLFCKKKSKNNEPALEQNEEN